MDSTAHTPVPPGHVPTAEENAQVSKHMRRYVGIGLVEIAMMALTVGLSLLPLSSKVVVALVLLSASVNAVVVAAILMHLKAESSMVWRFLYFTGIFFFVLFSLTLLYWSSPIMGSSHTQH